MTKLFRLTFLFVLIASFISCDNAPQKETEEILLEDSLRSSRDTGAAATSREVNDIRSAAVDNKPNAIKQAFPNLSSVNPGAPNPAKAYPNIGVYFNPAITKVINQADKSGPETSADEITILQTRIDEQKDELYTVTFSPGPSNDPTFAIYKDNEEIISIGALEIAFPGNGLIYTGGHINNLFDERRVFELRKGKITEVQQPFLFVGKQTKTKEPLTLYTDTRSNRVIGKLPKGAEVTVVLNEGNDYLIKDAFGIVGWWKGRDNRDVPFEDLQYGGD